MILVPFPRFEVDSFPTPEDLHLLSHTPSVRKWISRMRNKNKIPIPRSKASTGWCLNHHVSPDKFVLPNKFLYPEQVGFPENHNIWNKRLHCYAVLSHGHKLVAVSQHAVCVIHGNKWGRKFSTELTLKSQNIANVKIYRLDTGKWFSCNIRGNLVHSVSRFCNQVEEGRGSRLAISWKLMRLSDYKSGTFNYNWPESHAKSHAMNPSNDFSSGTMLHG